MPQVNAQEKASSLGQSDFGAGTFSISSKSPTEGTASSLQLLGLPPAEKPFEFTKRDILFQSSLDSIAAKSGSSVAQLRNGESYILGTIVSTDGLIVSKYSVAKDMQYCVLADGHRRQFRMIGIDVKKDLCLIQVNSRGVTPIKFRADLDQEVYTGVEAATNNFQNVNLKPPVSGTIAMSAGSGNEVAALGMVMMGHHDFGIEQAACPDCVDLGITVSPYPSLTRIDGVVYPYQRGIKVLRTYPRSVGERLGLLVGDLVNTVNGVQITERQVLASEMQKFRTGELITMKIFRSGVPKDLTYKVPAAKTTLYDRWGGGPYSDRRFGFGSVIVHDSVLNPQDCGGPLLDVDGRVIGVNIARSMRVASFAINIEDVYAFIRSKAPKAKLQFHQ